MPQNDLLWSMGGGWEDQTGDTSAVFPREDTNLSGFPGLKFCSQQLGPGEGKMFS